MKAPSFKFMFANLLCILTFLPAHSNTAANCPNAQKDWSKICRYEKQNEELKISNLKIDFVMMGDSITEFWYYEDKSFFTPGRIDRGISGQTSFEMRERFQNDVVDLKPRVVQIMAGTNDIAENFGVYDAEKTKANIQAMVDMAKQAGIKVMLGSVLPASGFNWNPAIGSPMPAIRSLNKWLKNLATENNLIYVDYFSAVFNGSTGLQTQFKGRTETGSYDEVHPNRAAYLEMEKLTEQALSNLNKSK